jgi:hypothetical protein
MGPVLGVKELPSLRGEPSSNEPWSKEGMERVVPVSRQRQVNALSNALVAMLGSRRYSVYGLMKKDETF